MEADDLDAALGAHYRLERRAGSGAMGEVWVALDKRGDERVAAKLLRKEHTEDPQLVARFVQERSILVGLRHPNLVAVRDLVVEGDRIAIVMDYVDGGSLRDELDETATLSPTDALAVTVPVLRGLAAAHDADVLHRDVKPDNVLLTRAWRDGDRDETGVRLTDFGIARIVAERSTSHTGVLGTPEYLCPELIETEQCGPPGDVYAVGVMLYELLAGRTPFAGQGSAWAIAQRHVQRKPPRIPVPDALWTVLERMLAKDPGSRPRAAEAARLLAGLAGTVADLPALGSQHAPGEYDAARGPQTVVRPITPGGDAGRDSATEATGSETPEVAPYEPVDLGEAESATMVRPLQRPTPEPRRSTTDDEPTRSRIDKRVLALVGGGVALVAVATLGVVVLGGDDDEQPGATGSGTQVVGTLTATQIDARLPTGLTVTRRATYDAETGTAELTLTYSADGAPLSGNVLEVLPGAEGDPEVCPSGQVTWPGRLPLQNQQSVTRIDAACGWDLELDEIAAGDSVDVVATVPLPDLDTGSGGLQTWLDAAAAATTEAVSDPGPTTDYYPVQRLVGVAVEAEPQRVFTQQVFTMSLYPEWPSGRSAERMFKSPGDGGTPDVSSVLQSVAGTDPAVRFLDDCGDGLTLSSQAQVVTALQPAGDNCFVGASVGNFTFLQSNPVQIVNRGS